MEKIKTKTNFKRGTYYRINIISGRYYVCDKEEQIEEVQLKGEDEQILKHLGTVGAYVEKDDEDNILTPFPYVHTHTHSEYSLLDGLSKIPDLAKKAVGAMAITDHGNCFGILKWQQAMKKEGKKAILGFEAYAETIDEEKTGCHLIFLAMNEIGKKNLFKLTSNSFDNFYRKPHVSRKDLEKYNEGLICTSACLGGEVMVNLVKGDYNKAKQVASFYKSLFGDNYYLEIQRHNIKEETEANILLIKLAKELGIKLIAANDSHYIEASQTTTQEILLCISTKKKMSEPHFKFNGDGYHLLTPEEMVAKFWDIPEAITSSIEIAEKCNTEIETGKYHTPTYEVPEGFKNDAEYLSYLIDKGYEERYAGKNEYSDPERIERLKYEKSVILNMGYASYFLIVWDYINWAKSNGIMVGPGRGSAAGSLVSYCLKITDLDPIPYNLLFERFLNPERVSMPDIDVDFEYSRRQEVIDYCRRKYGDDKVCNIITFGTMAAKSSIKDVARVYEEQALGNELVKFIPSEPNMTIQKAWDNDTEFRSTVNGLTTAKELIETAKVLEGNSRQTSVHACGIVIAPNSISDYIPTAKVMDEDEEVKKTVTQVTMTEVEEMGLLKMDFLGLRTMGVIGQSVKMINDLYNANIENYRDIPLNDPYVYEEIGKGSSFAVFQIESDGMRSFMTQLFGDVKEKIKTIEKKYKFKGFKEITGDGKDIDGYKKEMSEFGDELFERIIAGVALYRPGPMDYIPNYIEGMLNPQGIVYDTPELKEILKSTYGVIVYQEQVMQIVQKLAGFTMGRADIVRKAMGKKKMDIMMREKKNFINGNDELKIDGCIKRKIKEEIAEKIYDQMIDFAKYAFNKSHAAVYAMLTVVCAWLKHYYKEIYMVAVLNAYIDNADKIKIYLSACKKIDVTVLGPDVCKSQAEFTIEKNEKGLVIRTGLKAIKRLDKNVGGIIAERENGDFKSVYDFTERIQIKSSINKAQLEALIYSGAFDSFGYTRSSLINVVESFIKDSTIAKKDSISGQLSLFNVYEEFEKEADIPFVEEINKQDKLEKEKEYTGMYITEHPLDDFEEILKENKVIESYELNSKEDDNTINLEKMNGSKTTIAGVVKEVKKLYTKKDHKPMLIFTVEDRVGDIDCVLFPRKFENVAYKINEGSLLMIFGSISVREDKAQINVDEVCDLVQIKSVSSIQKLYVNISSRRQFEELQRKIYTYNQGTVQVIFQFQKKLYKIKDVESISAGNYMDILDTVGAKNVKVV